MQAYKARLIHSMACVNVQLLSEDGHTRLLLRRHLEISWKILSGQLPCRFRGGIWDSRWADKPMSLWVNTASYKPCRSSITIQLRHCSVFLVLAISKLQVQLSSALRLSSTHRVGEMAACLTCALRYP